MKANDLRGLSEERLQHRIEELRGDLEALREDVLSGKEKNHARLKQLRRDIARAHGVKQEYGSSN